MAILLSSRLYRILLCNISSYKYGIHSRINIRSLECELNASSIPIRECLIRLASEDFIDFHPGNGFFSKLINGSYFASNMEYFKFELYRFMRNTIEVQDQKNRSFILIFGSLEKLFIRNLCIEEFYKISRVVSSQIYKCQGFDHYSNSIGNQLMKLKIYIDYSNIREKYFINRKEIIRNFYNGDLEGACNGVENILAIDQCEAELTCKNIIFDFINKRNSILHARLNI